MLDVSNTTTAPSICPNKLQWMDIVTNILLVELEEG